MRRGVLLAVLAALATLALVAGGVLTQDDEKPTTPAARPFRTTPLADVDTSTVAVTRGPFCDAVDDRQVDAALGGVPDVVAWANGDQVDLTGSGQPDVAHEFGCSWTVPDIGTARAWVFAPPVDAAQAARLVKSAGKAAGCTAGAGPAFGSPTLALTCTDGATGRASYRGLFGDAWLVCEVERGADPGVDLADVAGRWCTGVLDAAETRAKG